MTKIDKISIAITREQHTKIKAAVERGDYATTSEVIRTALRAWELQEELRRHEGERIAKLWDEGIASGPGRCGDTEEIEAEARNGPATMKRLRDKYAAMKTKKANKRQRKTSR